MAQRAEREFVGVNVGIMDQFISALGKKDHALLIDTRFLTYEAVPLPQSGVRIVIADTNKKRGLVDSEYNTRRAECEKAVEIFQGFLPNVTALRDVSVTALRDVSVPDFEKYADKLPEITRKRARHVITEDARTLESVTALKAGDIARFGAVDESNRTKVYSDDYEVSCAELDAMVDGGAFRCKACTARRMTGAGFRRLYRQP